MATVVIATLVIAPIALLIIDLLRRTERGPEHRGSET